MKKQVSQISFAVFLSATLATAYFTSAPKQIIRSISNVNEMLPDDPEAGYKYGKLFHDSQIGKVSAQYLTALVADHDTNIALRHIISKQNEEFLGLFARPWSRNVMLINHVFDNDKKYKEILNKGPTLRFLFGENSGVKEEFSVGEHSSMVLNVFETQKDLYIPVSKRPEYEIQDFEKYMRDLLAFHDIGKSIGYKAIDKKDNRLEITFSTPIIGHFMLARKYSKEEVELAQRLIDVHKVIGDYLQNILTLAKASAEIKEAAAQTRLKTPLFFDLLELLFVCDSGSYPGLVDRVFDRKQRPKFVPIENAKLKLLRDAVEKR